MGKKSPPPKPPDLTPITNAQLQIARESNELAREFMGISRDQFKWMQENAREELELARQQADRLFEFQQKAFDSDQEAKEFARQVGLKQMEAMDLQMDYARRDRERYEGKFLPMQDRYIEEAMAYDTPERREAEAARAMVDIQRQAEAARENADSRLRSMGIDPSQVRSASLLQTQGVALAAQQAGAANAARTAVEDRGRAMRADALNVGAGLPAQALAGFAGAGGSGQGAVSAGVAGQAAQLGAIQGGASVAGTAMGFRSSALNNVAALTGSPTQWAGMGGNMYGQASAAYGNAANTMNMNYQNQMSNWKAGQEQAQQKFNNIMSVAALAGGMMAEGGEVHAAAGTEGAVKAVKGTIGGKPGKGGVALPEMSWFDRARARARANDPYIRQGEGSGEGGKLTLADRLYNGATAATSYQATNVFEDSYDASPSAPAEYYRPPPVQVEYSAEGGIPRMRARGALPVRQVRDKIPAWLSEGEYVVPADVVRAVGIEKLDKMVAKYHREGA